MVVAAAAPNKMMDHCKSMFQTSNNSINATSSSKCWNVSRLKPCISRPPHQDDPTCSSPDRTGPAKWFSSSAAIDDGVSEQALDGCAAEETKSCLPANLLLQIMRHHNKDNTNKISGNGNSNNNGRPRHHWEEDGVPLMTRISPTSSSDQDMPPTNTSNAGFRVARKKGTATEPMQPNTVTPALPLYHSPEATSIPLPHATTTREALPSSAPTTAASLLLCKKPTKLIQKALRPKRHTKTKKVKKVDPRTLQPCSLSDGESLNSNDDEDEFDSEDVDDITILHRNELPWGGFHDQHRFTGTAPAPPTRGISRSQFHSEPTLPINSHSNRQHGNASRTGPHHSRSEPTIWRPRVAVKGSSGIVALSNPSSFDSSAVVYPEDEPELYYYHHQQHHHHQHRQSPTKANHTVRGGGRLYDSTTPTSGSGAATGTRLTPDMLKEHEKKVARVASPTYSADPLARDVIQKKEHYEHAKEQRHQHQQHRSKDNSMSIILPIVKEQAKTQWKKLLPHTSSAKKQAAEKARQTHSINSGAGADRQAQKTMNLASRTAGSASPDQTLQQQQQEWERQQALSAKWHQKKQERIVRDQIEQMRLDEAKRQRSREQQEKQHKSKRPQPRRMVSF